MIEYKTKKIRIENGCNMKTINLRSFAMNTRS